MTAPHSAIPHGMAGRLRSGSAARVLLNLCVCVCALNRVFRFSAGHCNLRHRQIGAGCQRCKPSLPCAPQEPQSSSPAPALHQMTSHFAEQGPKFLESCLWGCGVAARQVYSRSVPRLSTDRSKRLMAWEWSFTACSEGPYHTDSRSLLHDNCESAANNIPLL